MARLVPASLPDPVALLAGGLAVALAYLGLLGALDPATLHETASVLERATGVAGLRRRPAGDAGPAGPGTTDPPL